MRPRNQGRSAANPAAHIQKVAITEDILKDLCGVRRREGWASYQPVGSSKAVWPWGFAFSVKTIWRN